MHQTKRLEGAITGLNLTPHAFALGVPAPNATSTTPQLILDTKVTQGSIVDSPAEFNDYLGQWDEAVAILRLDGVIGSITGVRVYHSNSPDEVLWSASLVLNASTSGKVLIPFNPLDIPSSGFGRLGVELMGSAGATARARIWWTGKRRGRRRYHELVFAEQMDSSVQRFTSDQFHSLLAGTEKLALWGIAEDTTAVGATLVVELEESGDGINWRSALPGPILDWAAGLSTTTYSLAWGFDMVLPPLSGFARLRIALGTSGGPVQSHIRIYATGRGE